MPQELPYLPSYKNVGVLFERIGAAKVPESFSQKYLYHTIGLKGGGDRPLISLLKTLGLLTIRENLRLVMPLSRMKRSQE